MIGEVEKDTWGLAFKIVTKRLVSRRKTPGLDNPDQVKYIVRSLFPHVEPFQRQDRSSCVVRGEEFFTLEEQKRAGGRLKANTAPGIDGLPNEILKDVIGVYPEILLEVFNSCLREGRFFADWKKQRLVLLRKGNKALGDASTNMFIEYDGETSAGNDPTKTTGSHGPREWSLGKPVRLSKRQAHSGRHPGSGGHRH